MRQNLNSCISKAEFLSLLFHFSHSPARTRTHALFLPLSAPTHSFPLLPMRTHMHTHIHSCTFFPISKVISDLNQNGHVARDDLNENINSIKNVAFGFETGRDIAAEENLTLSHRSVFTLALFDTTTTTATTTTTSTTTTSITTTTTTTTTTMTTTTTKTST